MGASNRPRCIMPGSIGARLSFAFTIAWIQWSFNGWTIVDADSGNYILFFLRHAWNWMDRSSYFRRWLDQRWTNFGSTTPFIDRMCALGGTKLSGNPYSTRLGKGAAMADTRHTRGTGNLPAASRNEHEEKHCEFCRESKRFVPSIGKIDSSM